MMQKRKTILAIICLWVGIVSCAAAELALDDSTTVKLGSLWRSYYVNDQRIQWSGVEATFGVEAVLGAVVEKKIDNGTVRVLSEFFINQPFERNILTDERRVRYLANFDIPTFEIARLWVGFDWGNLSLQLGKRETNFGRNYSLPMSNAFFAQPFIRTEAVLRYETGLFFSYTPGILDFSLAVVNGGVEMDTNSSKAGIVRLGLKGRNWALGVSAKAQDGIGSENQKQFKNHAGLDIMFKTGPIRLFAEVIYDEYGFRKIYDPDDVFWGRSLYYRDIFYKLDTPVTGIGGYVGLQYEGRNWILELNYGHYRPEELGDLFHDGDIQRGLVKFRLRLARGLDIFSLLLVENERQAEELFAGASPYAFALGLQYRL